MMARAHVIDPVLYTCDEWDALGDRRYKATAPALGASPSHSNYHLCALIQAVREGRPVSDRVTNSYTGTASETLRCLLATTDKET